MLSFYSSQSCIQTSLHAGIFDVCDPPKADVTPSPAPLHHHAFMQWWWWGPTPAGACRALSTSPREFISGQAYENRLFKKGAHTNRILQHARKWSRQPSTISKNAFERRHQRQVQRLQDHGLQNLFGIWGSVPHALALGLWALGPGPWVLGPWALATGPGTWALRRGSWVLGPWALRLEPLRLGPSALGAWALGFEHLDFGTIGPAPLDPRLWVLGSGPMTPGPAASWS